MLRAKKKWDKISRGYVFIFLHPIADACNSTIRANFLSQISKRIYLELCVNLSGGSGCLECSANKDHKANLMDWLANLWWRRAIVISILDICRLVVSLCLQIVNRNFTFVFIWRLGCELTISWFKRSFLSASSHKDSQWAIIERPPWRAVCGDNAPLARLMVRENTVLPYEYVEILSCP